MERLSCTNLWDSIWGGSDQTLVLASSIPMQMSRELRLNALGRLNRDNDVARQICDSCHYSKALESVMEHRGDSAGGGVQKQNKGLGEGMTYQPLQACESSMRSQPYCLYNDCPSAASEER